MANPKLGDIDIDILHGVIPGLKQVVETWRMRGVAGYGARTDGLGDSEFVVQAIKFIPDADLVDTLTVIEALQGTVITIVDDFRIENSNCLIKKIAQPKVTAAKGLNYDLRVEFEIEGLVLVQAGK
jgi:hypothetical protein